jgi:peptidoglycan L-alanyl-D-glutamate endopeptidase CwlK
MGYRFGDRSKSNLEQVDADLIKICYEVIHNIDFSVIEGHRTLKRQKQLFNDGKSQIDGISQKGNHNYLPSRAVDIIPYKKGYNPFDGTVESELMFYKLYTEVQKASEKLNIAIKWGGSWENFKDFPHFELA